MSDFLDELKENTVNVEDIKPGVHSNEDFAEKIKKDLIEKKSTKEISKKVKSSSENKPDKVQVKNLTKTQVQGLDDIE